MLVPTTLVQRHTAALQALVLGNPHSVNTPSAESSHHDEEAREAVLRYLNANPGPSCEYVPIWTANASSAIKIVGECFPFTKKGGLLYAPDCHNSVLGITEFAERKGAKISSFAFQKDSMCWDLDSLKEHLSMAHGGKQEEGRNGWWRLAACDARTEQHERYQAPNQSQYRRVLDTLVFFTNTHIHQH
jgi:selenocysteine lyase/cysteine desulfurase